MFRKFFKPKKFSSRRVDGMLGRPRKYRNLLNVLEKIEFIDFPSSKEGQTYQRAFLCLDKSEINCLKQLVQQQIEKAEKSKEVKGRWQKIIEDEQMHFFDD